MPTRGILLMIWLLLIFSGLDAQEEAESSTNVMILQGQHGKVAHVYERGSPIEFVMIDRQADLQKGTIESVNDSAVVVDGESFPVSKIGKVYVSDRKKTDAAFNFGVGAMVSFAIGAAAGVYLLIVGLYVAATVSVALVGFIFSIAFVAFGVIALAFLAKGSRKPMLMGKRFKLRIAKLLHHYPPQPR